MAWTMAAIRETNKRAGGSWFSRGNMRAFGTRLPRRVFEGPGGVFFVTSELPPHGPRMYTVRQFHPDGGSVDTPGQGYCRYPNARMANARARTLAQTVERRWEVAGHVLVGGHGPGWCGLTVDGRDVVDTTGWLGVMVRAAVDDDEPGPLWDWLEDEGAAGRVRLPG
jgi:hypothetical protein